MQPEGNKKERPGQYNYARASKVTTMSGKTPTKPSMLSRTQLEASRRYSKCVSTGTTSIQATNRLSNSQQLSGGREDALGSSCRLSRFGTMATLHPLHEGKVFGYPPTQIWGDVLSKLEIKKRQCQVGCLRKTKWGSPRKTAWGPYRSIDTE